MSDTFTGSNGSSWFTGSGWSTGATPTNSATGSQSVVVNGKTVVVSPTAPGATDINVVQTLTTANQHYTVLEDTQIGGELITLAGGADMVLQGTALGIFYGNPDTLTASGATMTGLHGALTATPTADMHMQISVVGTDTLTVTDVNNSFGFITIGNGDTLTINDITTGGNQQALHGLINYGEIEVSTGGELIITATNGTGSTVANFYNAGWIVDNGGTLSISSSVLDGASTLAGSGSVDGFIEIGNRGDVILSNTVSTGEEVTFTDSTANTLQITAGTLFSGTVNNFGNSDTIIINGFTSTSNATITTVGGVTELITTNGSVLTTITLTGSIATNITTGTNSSGQEVITSGGNTLSGNTTYASGTTTLSASSGSSLTNNGTVAVTGAGSELVVTSNVGGTGTFFVDYGATLALDNATGNDAGQTVLFGTHGSVANPNELIINDNSTGFGGKVTGFGANDDIVLGGSALPALTTGEGVALSYNNGVLTVTETSASGSVVGSSTVSIAGTAALSTASFEALEGTSGLNIELVPTGSTTYSFSASGTGSFESPANYTGGIAPGDSLNANTTVAVTAGTASVTGSAVTDNGLISIASGAGFIDAGPLTGTGTLSIASGGFATLADGSSVANIADNGSLVVAGSVSSAITGTGTLGILSGNSATLSGTDSIGTLADAGSLTVTKSLTESGATGGGTLSIAAGGTASLSGTTSLGGINDSGSLSLSGTVTGPITLASAGSASVAGNLVDSGSLTGTGTFTVGSGNTATLTGGASVTNIADNGSLVISGSVSSNITGTGTLGILTGTSATLSGADGIGTLADAGTLTITGSLTDTGPATGTGTLVVAQGATATLGTASSIHSVFDYGTLDLLGAMAGSINMEGNGAGSAVEFNTLNPSATITNFGLADTIVLASSLFTGQKAGTTLSLTGYSSKDVLTVTETLAAGGTQTDKITISGASNLALASFTQVTTSSGVEIELVPSNFTFTTTGSFENAAGYSGGVAPGDIIVSGETITIASGTATVTGEVLSNSGLITIASGADFIDTNTISGTGALIIGAGGTASLIGNTSLGSITDNGTLILGGTVTGPITIAGSASVTGSLVDTGSLSGSGTFTVGSGNAATLTGGAAVTNIADNGSLVVAGSVSSNITGTGTLATTGGASATLSGTDSAGTLADNGTLTVTGSLTDTGIASGTGTLAVAPGATVTLAAGSSIADIIDNGTLIIAGSVSSSITGSGTLMVAGGKTATLSGTDSLTGTLADAGTLIVTGSLTDSGAATGAGTLSIASGGFVTLAGGSSITTITDSGDLVAGGSVSSAISGIGTLGVLSGTSATLAATDSIGTLADNGTLTVTGSLTDTGIASGTGTLAVATGGSATLAGNTTLGSIIDNGSLTASGVFSTPITMGAGAQLAINGNFSDSDPITGLGTLTVDHGIIVTLAAGSSFAAVNDYGTLDLLGSLTTPINLGGNNTGSIIEFTGTDVTNGTLDTAITSFGYGDTIVLGSADFALNGSSDKLHESYNSSNGQLTITDSTSGAHVTLDLNLPAGDNTAALRVNDAGGQLEITLCFYPGTALATPKGEVKVEDIKAGDLLLTANGAKPVRWIGQSHIHTRFADPLRALPIRIRQGALGNGLPSRDLLLSPDHAICIDGILVQASALVNGTNIVREHDVPAQFTYYHVELDSHELLLAAGVQAESFVDNVDRMHFHNWDDRTAPDNPIVEMDLPRAKSSRQVPQAIRRRLGISQIAVA